MYTLSQQLRMRRALLNLSQRELAAAAHVAAATISTIEHDDASAYSIETGTLKRIAGALGCELVIELRPKAEK